MLGLAAIALGREKGSAAGVDPTMTIVKRPEEIPWKPLYNFPPDMVESTTTFGAIDQPGQYFVMIRWHPRYMSAPHWYETDRLCVVLSGVWRVASGEDFAPDVAVRAPAALSFIGWPRRRTMTGSRRAPPSLRSSPFRVSGPSATI
jgi:hypothetical protein